MRLPWRLVDERATEPSAAPADDEPDPRGPADEGAVGMLGLLALIAVVHLPLLRFGLVYDDGWTLRNNGFLRPGAFELGLLVSPEGAARNIPDVFRPTLVVFDMVSYRLLGLTPWAHHGLSIALHVGACALVGRLLDRLGAPRRWTLATVACFGLLAIHAEAIAVISYREDLLACCLGLAAVLAGLRVGDASSSAGRVGWGAATVVAMALACGAKLSAAPLVALLPLLAWTRPWTVALPDRKWLAAALGLMTLGVGLALAQRAAVHGGLSPYGADNPRVLANRVGLGPVLAASVAVHVGYLQQVVLPLGLSPEYVDRGASWLDPRTLASVVALVGLLAAACAPKVRERWPWASFAVLGWALLCLPTSNLVPLPNMRADRFMYLPSVPLCLGLSVALLELGDWLTTKLDRSSGAESSDAAGSSSAERMEGWVPLALFLLVQGSVGHAAARAYVSNTTLWHKAVERAPDSARAHALLGIERLATGRRPDGLAPAVAEAARRDCLRAKQLDPEYELPELCLAKLAAARRDWGNAYEHNRRAVELSVDRNDRAIAAMAQIALDLPHAWLLAHPELGTDRPALAKQTIERGLSAYPYSPELHAAAGQVFHRLGEPDRALDEYRRARSLRPERWETVVLGVELALDLGDAAAAHHTWWAEHEVLQDVDSTTRSRINRRLAAARANPNFSLLHSLLSPGVFPDDP